MSSSYSYDAVVVVVVVHILILLPSAVQSQPVYACDVAANRTLGSLGFCNRALSVGARVADLVSRLTLEEKVSYLISGSVGVSRLGIPKYEWWSEALHGVSYVGPGTKFGGPVPGATSFPQVITTAASFNSTLFEAIGKVVSTEARAMYNVGLAGLTYWSPNVNIFRDPRWGRGQETPGEDPLLSSKYASGYVRGLQQREDGDPNKLKVAACCKHYTAYDLDSWKGTDRFHFNAVVTQQDLEDTYQPPFKSCVVDGNVASVMCSYNQVNGKPTCADPDLLSGTVRGKWKLNGYIVSDCDSVQVLFNSQHYTKTPEEAAAKAILAGLDLNCGSFLAQHTPAAIKAGLLKESDVDKAISNNFATLIRLGFFDGNPTAAKLYGGLGPKDVCTPAHQDLAREAARQGIVLLKNNKNTLPFTNNNNVIKTLAVIGPNANVTKTMIGNYEGTPCKYVTPLQGLSLYTSASYLPGCPNVACTSSTQISDAAKLASAADATVLVMGIDQSIEAEGRDRIDLLLPGQQQQLVSAVANAASSNGRPVVLVIMSGGGFDISFAKNNDNITAILWVGYPGEAGGAALADIIFGAYNPSGRLPMTWYPQSYVDKVPMTNMNMRPDPSTGYPGRTYRFYTGQTVYTFGDGLSYTQFKHTLVKAPTNLTLTHTQTQTQTQTQTVAATHNSNSSSFLLPEAEEYHHVSTEFCRSASSDLDIHIKVTNTGSMPGTHIVFLFYKPKPNYYNTKLQGVPTKHLLAFDKIDQLGPHQEALLKFNLDPCKHLALVDQAGNTKISLGLHHLQIGDINHLIRIAL